MTMLFPAILQLSKSRANKLQADEASDKMVKSIGVEDLSNATDVTDVEPRIPGEVSVPDQQFLKLQDSEILERVNNLEVLSEVTEIPRDEKSNADHQYVKFQDLDKCTADRCATESANIQIHEPNLAGNSSNDPRVTRDSPYHRIDEVLEQLVSRVSRIEEVCLRFEENMLKPINRMEMRLQRVEEQLESLVKQSDASGLPAGTRFSAPSFSCNSNSSSIHKDGSDGHSFSRKLALDKGESSSCDLLNTCEGVPDSEEPPRLFPSLVVTAPEFSCIEDDQDADGIETFKRNNQDADATETFKRNNQDADGTEPFEGENQDVDVIKPFEGNNHVADVSKSFTDSPKIKPRSCLIDDVLAAALSNFLLSSRDNPSEHKRTSSSDYGASEIVGNEMSLQNAETLECSIHKVTSSVSDHEDPPKYTQILTVTAPEFTSDEIDGEEDSDSVHLPSEEASNPPSRTDGSYLVPPSLFENDSVEVSSETSRCVENKSAFEQFTITGDICSSETVSSETSRCVENKSAFDQFTITGDICSSETVENQFFEKYSFPWLLDGSSSSSIYQTQDSVTTDLCEAVKVADQRDSTTIPLSPGKRDFLEQNLFESASEEKDLFDKLFESGIGDARFTGGNSSTQTSLVTSLDRHPPPLPLNFTANSPRESGGIDFSADEYKFIAFEGNDFIDPQSSERLLLELGIYDTMPNFEEESSGLVGNHNTTSNQEMLASLI
ncbi:OLC1v1001477C1 [Oldenlandia corymbosa var. corymbosa]|nr:OLC1v1001477C1 [Oldenlandia corymbosa var. corymbosa]